MRARVFKSSTPEVMWVSQQAATLEHAERNGEVLVFLNPDTVAARGSIAQLVRRLEDPEIGIAMARLRLLNQS